jgi:hypothetical protein
MNRSEVVKKYEGVKGPSKSRQALGTNTQKGEKRYHFLL